MKRKLVPGTVLAILLLFPSNSVFAQTTADEWYARASEYHNSGDYTNAITAYSEAIRQNSSYLDAYWYRSIAYFNAGNYDASIADMNWVINRSPDYPLAYIIRGDAYGAKGIYHKAVADYRTGLEKGYDVSSTVVDKSNNGDMWFCGAMYMEIMVNRFYGNTTAVTRYENSLTIVCNNSNVTRTEIETFYRQGIRALVSDIVNDEFSTVRFMLNTNTNRCDVTMICNGNQYTLICEGYWGTSKVSEIREFSGTSLENLIQNMRASNSFSAQTRVGAGSDAITLDTFTIVREEAALIPVVVYADWKSRGVANGVDAIALVIDTLTNFYLNPNQTSYEAVRGIFARYYYISALGDFFAKKTESSYIRILTTLNGDLCRKIILESSSNLTNIARIPNDPRFNVFATYTGNL